MRNDRSGNVAVKISTTGILESNGSLSPRVNLIRPLGNIKMRLSDFTNSHWQEISQREFRRIWLEEVAQTPEYKESTFYLISGLLLPLWKHIDTDSIKVWRMQTDDGQQLLGRVVHPEQIGTVYGRLGINQPTLSAEEVYNAVLKRKQSLPVGRWQLKHSRIMNQKRIEVIGFHRKTDADILKAYGCFCELINYQARMFIPANQNAIPIIQRLMA